MRIPFFGEVNGLKALVSYLWFFSVISRGQDVKTQQERPESQEPYQEHKDWVHTLSRGCSPRAVQKLQEVQASTNPFTEEKFDLSPGEELIIDTYNYEERFGVAAFRRLTVNGNGGRSDDQQVMIGGGKGEQPVVFRFEMQEDGALKPIARELREIDDYAAGLDGQEGFIANLREQMGMDTHRQCYTTFEKPNKKRA